MAAQSRKEVREQKVRELVAACEQQRTELAESIEELRTPARFLEVGWQLAQVIRPGLQLFREVREVWTLRTPRKARSSLLSAWHLLSWAERARLAWAIGRWAGDLFMGRRRRRA